MWGIGVTSRMRVTRIPTFWNARRADSRPAPGPFTKIATVFIPLGFIAGLYGMNFDQGSRWNMPELSWPFGYFFALGSMAAVAGAMLIYFRRKGWF